MLKDTMSTLELRRKIYSEVLKTIFEEPLSGGRIGFLNKTEQLLENYQFMNWKVGIQSEKENHMRKIEKL